MIKSLLFATFLMSGGNAHAHTGHHPHMSRPHHPATSASVDIHWVWVPGHQVRLRWVRGHWERRVGPHPHANHAEWVWVSGRYVGHGHRRHWRPGHWVRRR